MANTIYNLRRDNGPCGALSAVSIARVMNYRHFNAFWKITDHQVASEPAGRLPAKNPHAAWLRRPVTFLRAPLCRDMDSTTTEKYQLVSEWLKTTFAHSKQVPEFEINKETIDCLFQLATLNRRRNEECEIITEDAQIKAKEYRLECTRSFHALTRIRMDMFGPCVALNFPLSTFS